MYRYNVDDDDNDDNDDDDDNDEAKNKDEWEYGLGRTSDSEEEEHQYLNQNWTMMTICWVIVTWIFLTNQVLIHQSGLSLRVMNWNSFQCDSDI